MVLLSTAVYSGSAHTHHINILNNMVLLSTAVYSSSAHRNTNSSRLQAYGTLLSSSETILNYFNSDSNKHNGRQPEKKLVGLLDAYTIKTKRNVTKY
jgi:hypothetical protein